MKIAALRYRTAVKSALPWVASLLAAILLFTPTYGIGLLLAPLTLIGTSVGLASPERASGTVQAGAAFNLLLLVAGLGLLTFVWWPTGWFMFAISWTLLVTVALLTWAAVFRRRHISGGGTWAV